MNNDEFRAKLADLVRASGQELIDRADEIVDKVADKFCEIGNINPLSKEEIEQSVNLSRLKED